MLSWVNMNIRAAIRQLQKVKFYSRKSGPTGMFLPDRGLSMNIKEYLNKFQSGLQKFRALFRRLAAVLHGIAVFICTVRLF